MGNAGILISFPDTGEEDPIYNSGCCGVWDYMFQAITDFDPQFAVFGHDKQDQSVIAAFLADPPCLKSQDSPLFDRIPLCGFVYIDNELVPAGFFKNFELSVE